MTNGSTIEPQSLALRATGAFSLLDDHTRRAVMDRNASRDASVATTTARMIEQVRAEGDHALREFATRFDGVTLDALEVPRAQWDAALATIEPALRTAMERAARNIATVHSAFRPTVVQSTPEPGITVTRRPDPLQRVGVYAPGGRATYPSSLLMGAIPARVAGVREIVVCSPPGANGLPSAAVLAAAAIAGVDRVFAVGGAGAIAAMALGTDSIPPVERIVGPGNAYVAEAKLQLMSQVSIDAPAGPSELLVLADATAEPDVVAREMLAQAEHDPDAAVIAVLCGSDSEALAARVINALAAAVVGTPRESIVRDALATRGAVVWLPTLSEGVTLANAWAAEHLLLLVKAEVERDTVAALMHAGTIFVGASSSVAFGDYMTGANHVLPTAGAARTYSGLSTLDFVRWTTTQTVTAQAAAVMARDVALFADAEFLPGHAAAARAFLPTESRS